MLSPVLQEAHILREYVQRMHSFRNAASINPLCCGVDVFASVWDALLCKSVVVCTKVKQDRRQGCKECVIGWVGRRGWYATQKKDKNLHPRFSFCFAASHLTSGVDTQENKCKQQTRVVSVCCQVHKQTHIRQTNTSGGKSQHSKDKRKESCEVIKYRCIRCSRERYSTCP